jgi:hypothetical protein
MGMDVIGNNPTSTEGEYFRNNVWWWRPLAMFCETEYSSLVGFDTEKWQYNSGDGLDEEKSLLLAKLIRSDIESGKVKEYEQAYRNEVASLERVPCTFCKSTGIRRDAVGIEHGMPEKELNPEMRILTGRTHGWCNSCQGYGNTEHPMCQYPFDTDNVLSFCNFLEHCGGFSIW